MLLPEIDYLGIDWTSWMPVRCYGLLFFFFYFLDIEFIVVVRILVSYVEARCITA
jgi:hypothetical protein